jgi:hypothetical protein
LGEQRVKPQAIFSTARLCRKQIPVFALCHSSGAELHSSRY